MIHVSMIELHRWLACSSARCNRAVSIRDSVGTVFGRRSRQSAIEGGSAIPITGSAKAIRHSEPDGCEDDSQPQMEERVGKPDVEQVVQ